MIKVPFKFVGFKDMYILPPQRQGQDELERMEAEAGILCTWRGQTLCHGDKSAKTKPSPRSRL